MEEIVFEPDSSLRLDVALFKNVKNAQSLVKHFTSGSSLQVAFIDPTLIVSTQVLRVAAWKSTLLPLLLCLLHFSFLLPFFSAPGRSEQGTYHSECTFGAGL
jgi:hypothetical protein